MHQLQLRIIAHRPNITAGRTEFVYTRPMIGTPQGDSPLLLNTSYTITAEITVPEGGAEGNDFNIRWSFYWLWILFVRGNTSIFTWNLLDLERIKWEGQKN